MDLSSKMKPGGADVGGFDVVQPGESVFLILGDGMEMVTKENRKVSFNLPLQCVKVVNGPAENEGKKAVWFLNMKDENGKELAGSKYLPMVLEATGLLAKFASQLGPNVECTNQMFVVGLKTDLPNKLIRIKHEQESYKDNSGAEKSRFTVKHLYDTVDAGGNTNAQGQGQAQGQATGAGGWK
jgi:hypothetical protein